MIDTGFVISSPKQCEKSQKSCAPSVQRSSTHAVPRGGSCVCIRMCTAFDRVMVVVVAVSPQWVGRVMDPWTNGSLLAFASGSWASMHACMRAAMDATGLQHREETSQGQALKTETRRKREADGECSAVQCSTRAISSLGHTSTPRYRPHVMYFGE